MYSISFTLVEASDITLSLGYGNKENKGSNDCPAIYVSHLKLLYSNINGPLLAALIAQAQSLGVASVVISAAQTTYNDIDNTPAYQTTIDNEISTLKTEINERIAALSLAHRANLTAIIPNADFESIDATTENNYKTGNGID